MKSFSLELLPQETLFSYVVRARLLSGFPSSSDFLNELIGSANSQIFSNLPSYIPIIAEEARVDADTLIDNHTLFPYFSGFLLPKVERLSRIDLRNGHSKNLHSHLSIIANRIPLSNVQKYCPRLC